MTDETAMADACSAYLSTDDPPLAADDVFEAGFAAGLAHARKWRPLTSDPASWPEEGQYVMFGAWSADGTRCWISSMLTCMRADMTPTGWSWWLPLPPPPKGESK